MRCLLDKVTARYILEGMLKLGEEREVTSNELFALDFYRKTFFSGIELFIAPQTHNLLKQLEHFSRYAVLIRGFLAATRVLHPTRYFKRWSRRLQEYGFTKEDSEVLTLATFGTGPNRDFLGMHTLATFDQPMINQWTAKQAEIQERLLSMQRNLNSPYSDVSLPIVERPEFILSLSEAG